MSWWHVWRPSARQWTRSASHLGGADFLTFYNRDRPHSAWGGRTPDEVHGGRPISRSRGRVEYFDGHLRWYPFG